MNKQTSKVGVSCKTYGGKKAEGGRRRWQALRGENTADCALTEIPKKPQPTIKNVPPVKVTVSAENLAARVGKRLMKAD